MSSDLESMVRDLHDRQEIHDCLIRYCRGVDRLDRDLLLSCYHADAYDDHGVFAGTAAEFVDWVLKLYEEHKYCSHHEITNHYCEIDGDTAHTETYWISTSVDKGEPAFSQARGRYVDRFEKRDGRWAISDRVCLVEMNQAVPDCTAEGVARTLQPRDRSDISYQRPLIVDRSRTTA